MRSLADGFDDEAWITQIARPCINDLCKDIVWPVTLLSPSGTSMLIRDTTDHASPLAVERFNAGFRLPLLMSASGRVYLAFCQPEQRDALLDILSRSTREEDKLARSRPEVEKILDETREQGYATSVRTRRVSEEVAMSVPVLIDDRVLATLAVRFSASAVPLGLAVERFYPKLHETAKTIRQRFSAAHPATADGDTTMKRILVGIKRVVDYNVRIRLKPDGSGIVTDGVKMSINPFDEIALEEALRIRERGGAEEVVAISIGTGDAQQQLRTALAMGADRAILVETPAGAGPTALEPLAAATVLLKLVKREQPCWSSWANRPSMMTTVRPARSWPPCGTGPRPLLPRRSN